MARRVESRPKCFQIDMAEWWEDREKKFHARQHALAFAVCLREEMRDQ